MAKEFVNKNFSTSSDNYLIFEAASLSSFKTEDNIIQAEFYGTTSFTKILSDADNYEIKFIDDFTCSVSTIYNNIRYFLILFLAYCYKSH